LIIFDEINPFQVRGGDRADINISPVLVVD